MPAEGEESAREQRHYSVSFASGALARGAGILESLGIPSDGHEAIARMLAASAEREEREGAGRSAESALALLEPTVVPDGEPPRACAICLDEMCGEVM